MQFSLDIETIPNLEMADRLPKVKVDGRLKDPEKIEAAIKEGRQKQVDEMALNPFYGRICAFAIAGDQEECQVIKAINDDEERALLERILDLLTSSAFERRQIITWNGMSFDLPYIYKRAILCRAKLPADLPALNHWMRRYTVNPHCDLMRVMGNWESRIHLDEAANMILGESKDDIDFRDFIKLILEGKGDEIGKYNLQDARLTYRLFEKTVNVLF